MYVRDDGRRGENVEIRVVAAKNLRFSIDRLSPWAARY